MATHHQPTPKLRIKPPRSRIEGTRCVSQPCPSFYSLGFCLVFGLVVARCTFLPSSHNEAMTKSSAVRVSTCRLPSADQQWMHSTITTEMLVDALRDPGITAIETDILMGYDTSIDPQHTMLQIPIAAHPPAIDSDLSVRKFLDMATAQSSRTLTKHIKLDFKDLEVVGKTLEMATAMKVDPNDRMVYLNADILPGPGSREAVNIDADAFMSTCLRYIDSQTHTPEASLRFAFSLGYRCDYRSDSGFTQEDLDKMSELVTNYNVMSRSSGLVLAINARLLSRNMNPFIHFIGRHPDAQILAWTGSGEPPISNSLIGRIKEEFYTAGLGESIGFDCSTDNSDT